MRIANPIYDSVFKRLMEDREIALGLLSRLLELNIVELESKPQEFTQRAAMALGSDDQFLRVFRVDFAAVVALADGSRHKVLIELQKAQSANVIGRFREYLGRHYAMPAKVQPILPIIAVYLLGFSLHPDLPKVAKVRRRYLDGVTGDALPEGLRDPFLEHLTHDAVVVQIPRLDDNDGTALERALQVFDQRQRDADPHYLRWEEETSDPLVRKMTRALLEAGSDEETRMQMQLEDELVNIVDDLEAARKEASAVRQEATEARQQATEARQQATEARQQATEARQEAAAALEKAEEERRQKEEERRQKEEALARLQELERLISESNRPDGR